MAYPDDFQAHAPGSPYAPVLSDDAEGFYNAGDQIEALASRLWALADKVRERGDEKHPDYSVLCDVRARLTVAMDAVAALENAN